MNRTLRLLAASAAAATLVTGGATLAAGASTALSATAHPFGSQAVPPWEPDPSSVGTLVFYNSSGDVITGGNLSDQPVAAYVLGTGTVRAGDTKATLYGFLPVEGQTPGQWSGEALAGATAYPNGSAPGSLATTNLPVETGHATDESIATLELDFPNTDTSSDGYADMYQLRLYTSTPGVTSSTEYDSADIEVDKSAGTWSVFYAPLPTASTLKTSATTISKGQSVTLTSTETPAAAGTVQFYEGSTALGSPVSSPAGTATLATTALAAGAQAVKAVFTPSNTNLNTGSTSNTVDITVRTPTATKIAAKPTTIVKGQEMAITAAVSPVVAGTVDFYEGTTKIEALALGSNGLASFETKTLPAGELTIEAVFVPTSSLDVGSSASLKVIVQTATTTKIAAKPTTINKGQSMTITGAVSPIVPGVVDFYDGKTKIAAVALHSNGLASFATTALPVGTLTLEAVFVPESSLYAESSATTKVTVKA
jgi:hypothetical protein